MKAYVFDANAILRYFRVVDAEGGDKVQEIFDLTKAGENLLLMSAVNFGEVYYVLLTLVGERTTKDYIKTLANLVSIIDADQSLTIVAATLKHRYKIGYADSFAAALAIERKGTLVSADDAFKRLGKELKWVRLPPYVAKPQKLPRHN